MGVTVTNNTIRSTAGSGIRIDSGSNGHDIDSNFIAVAAEHGIELNGVSRIHVHGNRLETIGGETTNTFDGILLEANVDNCHVADNWVRPRTSGATTRYGINVAASTCDNNVIVGNDLGGTAGYGTDALNDSGTGTILSYPGDATYGDNFVS